MLMLVIVAPTLKKNGCNRNNSQSFQVRTLNPLQRINFCEFDPLNLYLEFNLKTLWIDYGLVFAPAPAEENHYEAAVAIQQQQ